jgi:hypothetical protein
MTSATEWLDDHPGDVAILEEMLHEVADVPISVLTEMPQWMKQEIANQLTVTFKQPYWDDIHNATLGDAERVLERGLRDGLSIRQMADQMSTSFMGSTAKYAKMRATRIARTESTGALNAARRASMDKLAADLGPQVPIRPSWLSVLADTTRDAHANLDGVPANAEGLWNLNGVMVPWPGHFTLPPGDRVNCLCSTTVEFGMGEQEAQQLIAEHEARARGLPELHDFEGPPPDFPKPKPKPKPTPTPKPTPKPKPKPKPKPTSRGRITTRGIPEKRAKELEVVVRREVDDLKRFKIIEKADEIRSVMIRNPKDMRREGAASQETLANYDPKRDRILIRSDMNASGDSTKYRLGGWSVEGRRTRQDGKPNFGSAIRHEYGHRVHLRLLSEKPKREWKKLSRRYIGKKEGVKRVSKYGSSDERELFAESFTAYTSKGYKRGDLPKDIESFLDTYLGG